MLGGHRGQRSLLLLRARSSALTAHSRSAHGSRADSFAALASAFAAVERVKGSRDASVARLAAALRPLVALPSARTLASALSLSAAQLAPAHRGVELRFGTKSFAQLLKQLELEKSGDEDQTIDRTLTRCQDYGLAMRELLENGRVAIAAVDSVENPLTIEEVHEELLRIASVEGTGGIARKQQRAMELLRRCQCGGEIAILLDVFVADEAACWTPDEIMYVVRILAHQNLRIGMGDKSILAALAVASLPAGANALEDEESVALSSLEAKKWIDCVTRVYAQLPDFGALAERLHSNRFEVDVGEKLKWLPANVPPTVGVPVLTMSAYPVGSVDAVLSRMSKSGCAAATFEYKYDGARVQLHFDSTSYNQSSENSMNSQRVFSRNMEDTTEKYGSLLDVLARQVSGNEPVSFIMEGEVVALDRETGAMHPFQVLQAKATTEFCLFVFDLLALNGESLLNMSLRERRKRLRALVTEDPGFVEMVKSMDVHLTTEGAVDEAPNMENEIRDFLERAVASGCEGLMAKILDGDDASSYRAGSRSYSWMKLKQDYLNEPVDADSSSSSQFSHSSRMNVRDTGSFLPDTLDLVPIGAFYGKGKRSGVYGSFLLAAYNSSTGKFETIGKVGSGFSDAELAKTSARLTPLSTDGSASVPDLYVSNSIPSRHPDVWLEPSEVWEIKATQLTTSSSYTCGFHMLESDNSMISKGKRGLALRFPRFVRQRPDKSPKNATDSEQIVEFFRQATAN